jgi:hypothetical protein
MDEMMNSTNSRYMTKFPPYISMEKIEMINNKQVLKTLEEKYDEFIEKNEHMLRLNLYGTPMEYYLEIRDALAIKVSKLERAEKMNYLYSHT